MEQENPNELTTKLLAMYYKLESLLKKQSKLKSEKKALRNEVITLLHARRDVSTLIDKRTNVKEKNLYDIVFNPNRDRINESSDDLHKEIKYLIQTYSQIGYIFMNDETETKRKITKFMDNYYQQFEKLEAEIEQVKNELKAMIEGF